MDKSKSLTHCLKSDASFRTSSVLLSKPHAKSRQGQSHRKDNLLKLAAEKRISCLDVDENVDGKRLFVVRHGERMDFTFGSNWIQNSFDSHGTYMRFDLNMPKSLPQRKGGPQSFLEDPPLTVQGGFQARLLGEALAEKKVTFSYIYSSPALRCVQTAAGILSGLGITQAISLEPGIFEWMAWHQNGLPTFMTTAELTSAGYSINPSHQPVWNKFDPKETISDYYDRCHKVTGSILEQHRYEVGNILLVSHKGSVDVCVRQLVGNAKLSLPAFRERVSKVPYCAVSCCLENPDGKWKLVSPGISCFTHSANKNYDWKMWL